MFGTPEILPRLLYLVLLLVVVASYFVYEARGRIGQNLQMLAIWVLIFVGAVAGYGLKDEIKTQLFPARATVTDAGEIVLQRHGDGHFYVTARANGVPLTFVVDTGASGIVLSTHDARRLGFDTRALPYYGRAMTANGPVRTAQVVLDTLEFGPITSRDEPAAVSEGMEFGSLLGMSYLSRFQKLEIQGDRMILHP